jgi:hypothetical protein
MSMSLNPRINVNQQIRKRFTPWLSESNNKKWRKTGCYEKARLDTEESTAFTAALRMW